jgi:hypothetical protein
VPVCHSISARRSRATSPARSPSRTSSRRIARSRRRCSDLPSHAAIKRSTCSGAKYLGSSAKRQEANAGTALSRPAWHWPRTPRYRKKIRKLVISFSTVPAPHSLARSKKYPRTSFAFQQLGSSPSAVMTSAAVRQYCLIVASAAPRWRFSHCRKEVTAGGSGCRISEIGAERQTPICTR